MLLPVLTCYYLFLPVVTYCYCAHLLQAVSCMSSSLTPSDISRVLMLPIQLVLHTLQLHLCLLNMDRCGKQAPVPALQDQTGGDKPLVPVLCCAAARSQRLWQIHPAQGTGWTAQT